MKIWPARACAKTGARFGWAWRLDHPWHEDYPMIKSGPWKGWREMGYTEEDDQVLIREPWPQGWKIGTWTPLPRWAMIEAQERASRDRAVDKDH